jgi:hypothetical protein
MMSDVIPILSSFFRKPSDAASCSPVMVVGMHRSGTSVLAGSLQQAGLDLGPCSTWNKYNQRGNREHPEIMAFHEQLLARRGYAWHTPPSGAVTWTSMERRAASRIIASFRGSPTWGFKDPRATFFSEGWRHLLPRLRFVGIFRHPSAVAASLKAREGLEAAEALRIWLAYNRRLLALHREHAFPLVCFDDQEDSLHHQIDDVARSLGLRPSVRDRFFTGDLKHHAPADMPLPDEAANLYETLRNRQQNPKEVAA